MSFFLRTCWMWKMKQNLMRKKKKRRYQLIIIIIRIMWNPLSYWNVMLHKFILFQIEQLLFPKIALNSLGSRVGVVVRALAFHQCVPGSIPGPGVICGLSLLVLYSAPRGFSPGTPVFPSPQKPTFDLIWFDLFDLQSPQLVQHSCSARMIWDSNKVIIIIIIIMYGEICHSKSWTFPMNKSWNISGTFWILIL